MATPELTQSDTTHPDMSTEGEDCNTDVIKDRTGVSNTSDYKLEQMISEDNSRTWYISGICVRTITAYECSVCLQIFKTIPEVEIHIDSDSDNLHFTNTDPRSSTSGTVNNKHCDVRNKGSAASREVKFTSLEKLPEIKSESLDSLDEIKSIDHTTERIQSEENDSDGSGDDVTNMDDDVMNEDDGATEPTEHVVHASSKTRQRSVKTIRTRKLRNSSNAQHTCPICDQVFKSTSKLATHTRSFHSNAKFKCDVCLKEFANRKTLTLHMKTHATNKLFECSVCQQRLKTKAGCLQHTRKKHSEMNSHAGNKEMMQMFEQIDVESAKKKTVECDVCKSSFKTKHAYKQHVKRMHPDCGAAAVDDPEVERSVKQDIINHDENTLLLTQETNELTTKQCKFCLKSLSAAAFSRHVAKRTCHSPMSCNICEFGSRAMKNMRAHFAAHSIKLDPTHAGCFRCDKCDVSFQNMPAFHKHAMATHLVINFEPIVCFVCGKTYRNEVRFEDHYRVHHTSEVSPYQCEICSRRFNSDITLLHHKEIHNIEPSIPCDQCGKLMRTKTALRVHIKNVHSTDLQKCPRCDFTSYARKDINSHMLRVHTIKKYRCDLCSKMFKTRLESHRHLLTHATEKSLQCTICLKYFKTPFNLKNHRRSHSTTRNCVCSQCGAAFKTRNTLREHITNIHTDARNYRCELCGKTFKRPRHLKNHMALHSGVKEHKCDICGREFYLKNARDSHKRIQHGVKSD